MINDIQTTQIEAFKEIVPELGKRRKLVLDALKTLDKANNKIISVFLGLGVNQVTGRINELRQLKMVGFSHEAECPYSGKNTMYWKLTKLGEEEGEVIGNPKTANLIIRPFIVTDGLDKTTYNSQIKSSIKPKFYNVEVVSKWDQQNKCYYFESLCECEGYLFRNSCKHIDKLMEELNKWNEI